MATDTTPRVASLRDDLIFGFLDDGGPNYLDRALALIGTFAMRCIDMDLRAEDHASIEEEADLIIEEIKEAPSFEEEAIRYVEMLRRYFLETTREEKGVTAIVEDESFPRPPFSDRTLAEIEDRSNEVVDRILTEKEELTDEVASTLPHEELEVRRIRIGLVNNVRILLRLEGCIRGTERTMIDDQRAADRMREMVDDQSSTDRLGEMADPSLRPSMMQAAAEIERQATSFLFRASRVETGEDGRRFVFWTA